MKNLLRKLHIGSSHDELSEGSRSSTGKSQEGSFLQKLHIGGSHDDLTEGSRSSGGRSQEGSLLNLRRLSFSETGSSSAGDQKPFSGLSGWLTSVARHTLSTSSANVSASQGLSGGSPKHRTDAMGVNPGEDRTDAAGSNAGTSNIPKADPPVIRVVNSVGVEEGKVDTGAVIAAEEKVGYQVLSMDEDYQIQLAMALSVNDDPEAVQIETVKQISLGFCPSSQNTPAEVVAYRYWNYNVLNYDDKVVDGFYDVYGVVSDSSSETMPSLVDLQGTPVSGNIIWEVILVNRATDPDLVNLEQRALTLAVNSRISAIGLPRNDFIQKIADLVVQHMGGKVADADDVLKRWRTSSEALRSTLQNIVLPVGCLHVGLARHRALLFKVLADSVGIPCRLVKGRHYTGSNEGAVNIIKVEDGREYIIDLMGAPGTLIPSDVTGSIPAGADSGVSVQSIKNNSPRFSVLSNLLQHGSIDCQNEDANRFVELLTEKNVKDVEFLPENSTGGAEEFPGAPRNVGGLATAEKLNLQEDRPSATNVQESGRSEVNVQEGKHVERYHSEPAELQLLEKPIPRAALIRPNYPFAHLRSPSWTEGIGSHAARDMKDVSQYMMHAAKENPKLAQKLHDVLAESGVVAPPNLFTEISPRQFQAQVAEEKRNMEEKDGRKETRGNSVRRKEKSSVGPGRPPVAAPKLSSETEQRVKNRPQRLKSVEGLGEKRPLDLSHTSRSTSSPHSPPIQTAATPSVPPAASVPTAVQESIPSDVIKHVPVAAAAAATAAVVASSMVAAATKSDVPDPTLEVPVAAAATATAAVVAATSAVVGRKLTISETIPDVRPENEQERGTREYDRRYEDTDGAVRSPTGSGPRGSHDGEGAGNDVLVEEERVSDKSSGSISAKSDSLLDDVAEWEIPWEDIIIGERIGLGSYGEVYRGDWHGTEVSVKKFLDQDISGDALEEFRSEVRIMRRLRHPNVVLFMGAVTRSPNLSIVTEFLPRGSLYRLIHRPNNQLDERRRMRMALDVARGMNYLHSSTPVIVHRDLKSPNLLVDRNWVVKVCDFGLSRMKHNTFLSSKSTAGTPEWMAPEVLRNEPSNEKCDVYSFGVILWELATLQQPWSGMNPMQVVGAVGFQHRCLEIPDDLDPVIARIIRQCWQSDPRLRPSFAEIMAELKPLQKALVAPRAPETSRSVSVVDCAPP